MTLAWSQDSSSVEDDQYFQQYQAQKSAAWDQLMAKNSFLKGEKLEYDITYGFITAGKARMETKWNGGHKITHKAHAHALSAIQTLYPVFDTITTRMEGPQLLPSEFYKITNEGSYHSRTRVQYNQLIKRASMGDSVLHGDGTVKRFKDTTVLLDGPSHSITSAFMLIRTLDLKPGQTYQFLAVSGKKKYKLKVIAHKYETIEVQDKEYSCLKVEPVLDEDGLFRAEGKMTIWITRDQRRLPVLVRSKIPLGSVELELVKVTYP